MKAQILRAISTSAIVASIFIANTGWAQKVQITPSLRKEMIESAQRLFAHYNQGISCDWSDSAQVNEYRRCFHNDATIFDDISPDTASVDLEGNFRFKSTSLGNFSTRNVDSLFRLNQRLYERNSLNRNELRLSGVITNARFNFSPMVNGAIEVVFEKVTDAVTNFGKQRFDNRDTLRLVIRFDKIRKEVDGLGIWTFTNPKISRIERYHSIDPSLVPISYSKKRSKKDDLPGNFTMVPRRKFVDCPRDRDCDGVPDNIDLCPNETGFDPDGCPSIAIVNGLTISATGVVLGRTKLSELSQERLGVGTINSFNKPEMEPGNNFGIKLGLEYDVWFGKYKNYGFGFGGFYSFSTGQFNSKGYQVSFLRNDNNSNSNQIRQTVKVDESRESVSYNTVSLPFFLKYSGKQRELRSFTYFVHAGAFLQLFTRGSSKGSIGGVDYEMNFGQLNTTGFSENTADPRRNWQISEDRLKKYEAGSDDATSTAEYLRRKQAAGFNVGINESRDEKRNSFNRVAGIGIILRVGGLQRLSRNRSLLLCAEIQGFSNPVKPSVDYSMTSNVASSDYQTLLSATGSFSQWSFGFSGAYQFKLNPRKSKNKE